MASVNKVIIVGNLGRDAFSHYDFFTKGFPFSPYEQWLEAMLGPCDASFLAVQQAIKEMRKQIKNAPGISLHEPVAELPLEWPYQWPDEWFGDFILSRFTRPYQSCQHARNCTASTRHRRMKQHKPCGGFFSASKANLRNAP